MGPDPILNLRLEDEQLCPGMPVMAHWRRDGSLLRARGVVIGLTPAAVRVRLQEAAGYLRNVPVGTEVEVPRFRTGTFWSSDNCVRLLTNKEGPGF